MSGVEYEICFLHKCKAFFKILFLVYLVSPTSDQNVKSVP